MSSAFSKEEKVAFETIMAGYEDALVISKEVDIYNSDSVGMARSNDTIWMPQEYIAQSFDGLDQTGNFVELTQLSVPATLGYTKSAPWTMDSKELRDALQNENFGKAAKNKLASDINVAVLNTLCNQATVVVPVTTAAGDYDDVALCDSAFNEVGIPMEDRVLALSSRSYNGMAGNLATATRSFGNAKSENAYEKSFVGEVAGFRTFKMDYANRIAAEGVGSLTMDTRSSASNYHTPIATRTAATGETSNYDNRYQQITISATTGIVAGDCFTIAGVEACHHITKGATGQLKTFRVIEVVDGTKLVISPAIVSNQGGTDAEAQYQNVIVTESATAALVWLNTTAADINPFWVKGAIKLLPGRLAIASDAGAGVIYSTTSNGIQVVFQKQFDINTSKFKYRLDTFFGVCLANPEMAGILLFGQA